MKIIVITKNSVWNLIVSMFMFLIVACNAPSRQRDELVDQHAKKVSDGYKVLPTAQSLSLKFPVVSFIENFFSKPTPKKWNTFFILEERYEVIYEVSVKIDESTGRIEPIGPEKITVVEINSVDGPLAKEVSYGGLNKQLDVSQIKTLKASGWNFSSVGIPLGLSPIPHTDAYFREFKSMYEK
jgi:hypothetical protein